MKKSYYKKPNFLAYLFFRSIGKFVSKVTLKTKVLRNELKGVHGPAVVLMTHESGLDHCCLSLITKRRLTFVISESLYNTTKFFRLFKLLHTVNKKQFRTGIDDIKEMKAVIENNGCLVIFPAGVCTACGTNTDLPSATGKFLKFLGTDVYIAKLNGVYLSNPKWSDIKRRGITEIDIYKLISAEKLKERSQEDLYKLVDEALKYDEYEWQENKMVKFRNGENVVGLENVLYSCPCCKAFGSISCKGKDTLFCEKCGYEEKADEYCMLHKISKNGNEIKHISDWAVIIRDELKERIRNDNNFKYEIDGEIRSLNIKKHQYEVIGDGKVTFDKNRIILTNKNGDILFNESTLSFISIPSIPGKFMDLQYVGGIFRFYPHNGKDVQSFVDSVNAISELHKENN